VRDAPTRFCSRHSMGHPSMLTPGEPAAAGLLCPRLAEALPWVQSRCLLTASNVGPTLCIILYHSNSRTVNQTRAPTSTAMSAASTRSLLTTQSAHSVSQPLHCRASQPSSELKILYRHEMSRPKLRPSPRPVPRSKLRPLVQCRSSICPLRSLPRPYVSESTRFL
jgi:hypothetical protein